MKEEFIKLLKDIDRNGYDGIGKPNYSVGLFTLKDNCWKDIVRI